MSSSKCGSTPQSFTSCGELANDVARTAPASPCAGHNGSAVTLHSEVRAAGTAWSPDEEAILRRCYPDQGAIGTHALLPNRSLDAIRAHAGKLGVHDLHRTWSPGEIECLKLVYPRGGADCVHERLPQRSLDAIRQKASELAIKHDRRSATAIPLDEITKAIQAADGNAVHAARVLGCDYASLRRIATSNGLLDTNKDSKPHWKTTEVDVLRREYPGGGAAAVCAKLPHRSKHAIYRMAKRLGLTGSS